MDRKVKMAAMVTTVMLVLLTVLVITLTIDSIDPSMACCSNLTISGTKNADPFYQSIMGVYEPYANQSSITYGDKNFPVYMHILAENRSEFGMEPRHSFLYYYKNEIPALNETECPDGCWMIGMYDPTPGNYWFGRKYWRFTGFQEACPDSASSSGGEILNDRGQPDSLNLKCLA